MKTIIRKSVLASVIALAGQQATALNITFDYSLDSNNFFDTQAKRDVLSAAGSYFGNLIQDELTAIESSGANSFDAYLSNPASGDTTIISDLSIAADTLVIYTGGRLLGENSLGLGGPGGYSASGFGSFVDNAATRGQAGETSGAGATDFAPWGGSLTFNSAADWYFDTDPSTNESFSDNDFYSVALHEIGHLLGVGLADSWSNQITGALFNGVASAAVYGEGVPVNGEGSHWAEGTEGFVNGVLQEAAMDPSIVTGTRKVFTDLDVAALSDIGWEVAPVPVPAAAWLFGSSLLGLATVARKRSRHSRA
mgnify:CR=1 FL=1